MSDATTISTLELEIHSSAKNTESGLNDLINTLGRLKMATKGGLGLTSVVKQLNNLNTATNGINSNSVNNVTGLASAIQLLSGTKISSTIGKQITEISTALSGANFSGGEVKITELVTALKPLESLGKTSLGSTVNALKKLPEVFDGLKKIDMDAFGQKIVEVTAKLKPLADEMQKVANGFSAFPSKIQRLISSSNSLVTTNGKVAKSYVNLYAKLKMAASSLKGLGSKMASMIQEAMGYDEIMNLFTISMGKYAKEAYDYAQQVSEILGIDPAQWMRNQGTLMTLATGFGVAGDRAKVMSQQLTQLAYDISSFIDIPAEEAMTKLQSGFAGELEPLRAIGYDLSQAKLQAIAYSLGIDRTVSSMTQAEKAELRYYAIMTQVTTAQGDMARTLESPANQMRIFRSQVTMTARAIGSIFIPILNKILPYAIAVAKVIRILASTIASLFGYELPEVDFSEGLGNTTSGVEDVGDALDKASSSAKKLKSYMLGFDELNVINPDDGSGSSGSGSGGAGGVGGFDFELPTYDFLEGAAESKVNQIVEDMKEWLGITDDITSWSDLFDTKLGDILILVGSIAAGLIAWKLSDSFLTGLSAFTTALGVGILIDSIACTLEEGLSWKSVIEGAIGGALIGAGLGFKFGGWQGAIGGIVIGIGISLIINGITGAIADGVNVEDVVSIITGVLTTVGGIITVIKLFNKEHDNPLPDVKKASETIEKTSEGTSTLTTKLKDLAKNLGLGLVILAEVAAAAVLVVGAIWLLGIELDNVGKAWTPVIENAETVTIAMGIGTVLLVAIGVLTNELGKKGKTMATDIAIGTAILLEIGVATALFIGEIWAIGKLLDEVGKAWQPVLDNGETITTAILAGTAILVLVGALAGALGIASVESFGLLPIAIGLGTALLVEVGVAAGLFIAEILAIGILLDKVGKAWKPVLDNGDTIKKAIKQGTKILIAIGVVSAALGVATVASAGLLPIAIGLGTALLVEVGDAAGVFTTEITKVGNSLVKVNNAWKPINKDGAMIEAAIKTGTKLLIAIGTVAAALGVATIASVGLLPLAIDLGTDMLVDLSDSFITFTNSLIKVANQMSGQLYTSLVKLNSRLPTLSTCMTNFTTYMGDFVDDIVDYTKNSALAGIAATIDKFVDFFTTDPIDRLTSEVSEQYDDAVDLIDELKSAIPKINSATLYLKMYNAAIADLQAEAGVDDKGSNTLGVILEFAVNIANDATTWWSNVKKWWSEKIGKDSAQEFKTSPKNDSLSWWTNVKSWWGLRVGDVSNFTTKVKDDSNTWWSNVKKWWSGDSSSGVDVKVNAKKGWSGTIKNFLGIPDNYSLGFKLPKIKVSWGEKTVAGFTIKYPSGFSTYAQGGFPDMGQMFIAREAGPELVGNIGSRTAVVNNDQIVESVSTGVYQAVIAALGSGNGDGDNTQIVINLDGEKIYENQQKIARNRGYNLGMGAFSFG